MYIEKVVSFRDSGDRRERDCESVPPEVARLYRREREIAVIVYGHGVATATDVQLELSARLSNAAIRSMLGRLVGKGILTRVKCGPHGTYVYAPALTRASAQETALKQFAVDFYAGSLVSLAEGIADLFASAALPAASVRGRALRLAS